MPLDGFSCPSGSNLLLQQYVTSEALRGCKQQSTLTLGSVYQWKLNFRKFLDELDLVDFLALKEEMYVPTVCDENRTPMSQQAAVTLKESTETYLLELTPYKGLCIVICLLNGH